MIGASLPPGIPHSHFLGVIVYSIVYRFFELGSIPCLSFWVTEKNWKMNTCTSCLLHEEGEELLQSQRFMYIPYSLGYKVKMMTLEKN